MLKYEEHAREWILNHIDTLNALWNDRDSEMAFAMEFESREENITVTSGQTRLVIIGEDFVIKINKPKNPRWEIFGNSRDEVRMYKQAVKDGYDWLFARIRAMIIEHHTYYVMEKVDAVADDCGVEDDWCSFAEDYLNEEQIEYVSRFVFDVHCQNFGFIDDEPVIFDYAANYC